MPGSLNHLALSSPGLFFFLTLMLSRFASPEDSEESSVSSRVCSAAKYTFGFVIFFVVLLVLGIVLKKGGSHAEDADWRDKLSNDFTSGEAVLSFSVGCLACLGLMAYVVYAAYGLSRLPLKLMSRAKVRVPGTLPTSSLAADGSRTGLLAGNRRSRGDVHLRQTQGAMNAPRISRQGNAERARSNQPPATLGHS